MDPDSQGTLGVGPPPLEKEKAAFLRSSDRVGNSRGSQPYQSILTTQTGVSPEHNKVLVAASRFHSRKLSGQERGQRQASFLSSPSFTC